MALALLLVPALLAPAGAVALLWAEWFSARPAFAALFGHRPEVVLHPTAWQAFSGADVLIALCAAATIGAVLVLWATGRFVLWTAGAAAAAVGATVCIVARNTPPAPGPGIFTDRDVAYAATAAPFVATGCFVVAALCLMGYALVASRLSRRPAPA